MPGPSSCVHTDQLYHPYRTLTNEHFPIIQSNCICEKMCVINVKPISMADGKQRTRIQQNWFLKARTITYIFISFKIFSQTQQKKQKKRLQTTLATLKRGTLLIQQKGHKQAKSSYQRLHPILFLHLLPQLLEAGLQAVVERPQSLCDLLSVDADTFGEVRDL